MALQLLVLLLAFMGAASGNIGSKNGEKISCLQLRYFSLLSLIAQMEIPQFLANAAEVR